MSTLIPQPRDLERRRRAARIPLARLARLAGVDRQYLREVVFGKRNPTIAWLLKVDRALSRAEQG